MPSIRNEPMFAAPPAPELTLSKALAERAGWKPTYAAYRVKGRVLCDECVNVLHEAKGKGEPPRGATTARNVTGHPDKRLLLCTGHGQMWKALDGIGEKKATAPVRGRR